MLSPLLYPSLSPLPSISCSLVHIVRDGFRTVNIHLANFRPSCCRCLLRIPVSVSVSVSVFRLKDGMVFNLSVGLQDVPLSAEERKGSGAKDMETFSVLIAGRNYKLRLKKTLTCSAGLFFLRLMFFFFCRPVLVTIVL